VADDQYTFEFLCAHHSLEKFVSGSLIHDTAVREHQAHLRALTVEPGGMIVATTGTGQVAGLIGTTPIEIVEDPAFGGEGSDRPAQGLWLYYQLILVGAEYQGSKLARVLLEKVEAIAQHKLERNLRYVGELASPRVSSADYENARSAAEGAAKAPPQPNSLERYLLRKKFRPIDDDPLSWLYRPRRRSSLPSIDS